MNTRNLTKLFNSFLKVFTTNWSIFFIDFIIGVAIINYLGAEFKGQFSAFLVLIGLFASTLSFGLNQSNVYFQNKRLQSRNSNYIIQLYIQLLFSLFLIFILIFYVADVANFLKLNTNASYIIIISIILSFNSQLFTLFLITDYLAEKKIDHFFKLRFGIVSIKLLTVIACVLIGFNIVNLFLIYAIFEFIYVLLFFIPQINFFGIKKPQISRHYFLFGLKSHINVIIQNIYKRFDYFIIITLTSIEVLGKYSIALIFYQLMLSIPQALNGLLFGDFIKKKYSIRSIFKTIFFTTLILALFMSIIVEKFLFYAYGPDLVDMKNTSIILIFAGFFSALASIFKIKFISLDKAEYVTYEQIITGTIQIFLMYSLIDLYGVEGVAVAVLSGAISSLTIRYLFKRYVKGS